MGEGECAGGSWQMNRHCHYKKPNILGKAAKILLVQRGEARVGAEDYEPYKTGVLQAGHVGESTVLPTRMLYF